MIRTENGEITIKGTLTDIQADLTFIILKLLDTQLFTFKNLDEVLRVVKKNAR